MAPTRRTFRPTRMQRYAIECRAAGFTYREAGADIGRTAQAMKKRVNRARRRALQLMSDAQRRRYLQLLAPRGKKVRVRSLPLDFTRHGQGRPD